MIRTSEMPVRSAVDASAAPSPIWFARGITAPLLVRRLNFAVVLTIGTRVLQIVAGVTASIVTARFLAPTGRGEYFVAITLARTLAQFGNLGQQSSNTYLVARDRTLLPGLVTNSLWISIVVGGGGAFLVLTGMHAGRALWGTPPAILWFAALLAPISLFYMLGTNLLVGIHRFGLFNGFEFASGGVVLAAIVVAGLAGAGPAGFLAASIGGWTIVAAALLLTLRLQGANPLRFQTDAFRSGLRYSAKAYLATLAGFLLLRSNVFILSAMKGADQVGYYSVATQFADVLSVLPQSAALVLFPSLVSDRVRSFDRTIRNMVVVGVLLGAGCLAVVFLADPMIRIAFGPRFLPAASLVRQLLPGVLFSGITAVVSQYLSAGGFPRAQVAIWFCGFAAAATMSWLLIPRMGAAGAAIALSIAHIIVFVLLFRLAWATHQEHAALS